MKIVPKTEAQLDEENRKRLESFLIPDGTYPFEVVRAENATSKKGNEMIHLELRVFVDEKSHLIEDWLLESFGHKLFHFCQYTGLAAKYKAGQVDATDCENRSGYVVIGKQKGQPNPKGGVYPDQNTVKDYARGTMTKNPVLAPKPDEDVPF